MNRPILYFAPDTCSRVTGISLFEAGVDFEPHLIRFRKGEHRSAEYLALNHKGKVPTLMIDGKALSENVAIVWYLATKHPESGLLPLTGAPWQDSQILSDLAWCASGLHPIVARLRIPQLYCDGDGGPERVREIATKSILDEFSFIDQRLADRDWYYGRWSSLDAYLYWVWFRVTGCGIDCSGFEHYAGHADRMADRDSTRLYLAIEAEAHKTLDAEGLSVNLDAIKPR